MKNMIDITGADLKEVVKAAYDLSRHVGLGIMHFQSGSLTDEDALQLINEDDSLPVEMDYVRGRCCKFNVFKEGDKLFIRNQWYDHTAADLRALLRRIGIDEELAA